MIRGQWGVRLNTEIALQSALAMTELRMSLRGAERRSNLEN